MPHRTREALVDAAARLLDEGGARSAGNVPRAATRHYAGWARAHPERFKLVFGRRHGDDLPELGAAA
ncbi:hypothetical protein BAY59_08020 [Prauserella coralliicola]|nr:hypothetical protein BAY59_08020 [Prauserella coralliicola]